VQDVVHAHKLYLTDLVPLVEILLL